MEFELINHLGETNMRIVLATIYNRSLHFHNDIEIIMPLKGSLLTHVGNKSYLIGTGEIFLLSQNEVHSACQTDEDNLLVVFEICPNFCRPFFSQLSRIHLNERHISSSSHPELYSVIMKCMIQTVLLCSEQKPGYELLINEALCNCIYNILYYTSYTILDEDEVVNNLKQNIRIAKIIDSIKNNYTSKLTLAELAESEGLNPSYLSRLISDNLGMSFRDYVNKLRAEKAVFLLQTTNMSQNEICIASGFSDKRYLNAELEKQFGKAPNEIRCDAKLQKTSKMIDSIHTKEHLVIDVADAYSTLIYYLKKISDSSNLNISI